jgi:hypothetical protein
MGLCTRWLSNISMKWVFTPYTMKQETARIHSHQQQHRNQILHNISQPGTPQPIFVPASPASFRQTVTPLSYPQQPPTEYISQSIAPKLLLHSRELLFRTMGHPCIYNIVQLKEDGVPDAKSKLNFSIFSWLSNYSQFLYPCLLEPPLHLP